MKGDQARAKLPDGRKRIIRSDHSNLEPSADQFAQETIGDKIADEENMTQDHQEVYASPCVTVQACLLDCHV